MRPAAAFLLFVIVFSGCRSTPPEFRDTRAALEGEISRASCENPARLSDTRELFERHGANVEIVEYENVSNVLVRIDGKSRDTIIVGAHFDKTTLGCGVIDNWTGVVMIAKLLQDFKAKQPSKSYVFAAFGGEEQNLLGSRAMAEQIATTDKERPCAMVNLDSFGFEKTWGLKSISDRTLLMLAADVERERGGSFSIRSYRGASSDSQSFRNIGIPSITFSGLGDDWRDYLHQDKDQVTNIDFEAVTNNYLFLKDFISAIDAYDCKSLS